MTSIERGGIATARWLFWGGRSINPQNGGPFTKRNVAANDSEALRGVKPRLFTVWMHLPERVGIGPAAK
jgi:hypothetical protein